MRANSNFTDENLIEVFIRPQVTAVCRFDSAGIQTEVFHEVDRDITFNFNLIITHIIMT